MPESDRHERLVATLLPLLADWVDDLNVDGPELYSLLLTLAARTAHAARLSVDDVKRGIVAVYEDLPPPAPERATPLSAVN